MNEQIEKHGLDSLSTYGIMRGSTDKYIRNIIDQLRMQGYLSVDSDNIYRIPSLTPKARDVLLGNTHVFIKEQVTAEMAVKKAKKEVPKDVLHGGGLLEQLKKTGKAATIIDILQAVFTTALVDVALVGLHFVLGEDKFPLSSAIILGAIASATAPAATLMVVRQYKAKGKLTNLLLPIVALDDAVGLIIFAVSFGFWKEGWQDPPKFWH